MCSKNSIIYILVWSNAKRLDSSTPLRSAQNDTRGRTLSISNLNASAGCVLTTSNLKGHEMADLIIMEEVVKFLKDAGAYFLATVDGDQPKVRPFGTAEIFEGKLYIQTGKSKNVSKQIAANPKVQICAMNKAGNEWVRITGTLVEDDRLEPKVHMLDAYPSLKAMYKPEDPNTQVLYFKDAEATFCSFTAAPRTVKF